MVCSAEVEVEVEVKVELERTQTRGMDMEHGALGCGGIGCGTLDAGDVRRGAHRTCIMHDSSTSHQWVPMLYQDSRERLQETHGADKQEDRRTRGLGRGGVSGHLPHSSSRNPEPELRTCWLDPKQTSRTETSRSPHHPVNFGLFPIIFALR